MTRFSSFLKGSLAAVGIGVRSSATQAASSVPTITSGTGAPSASEPNGSTYLRTDGAADSTIYQRVSAAWVAIEGTGVAGAYDTISEVTADAGVTVDGVLLKDEGIDWSGAAIASGDATIKLRDNLASALVIKEGANDYLKFVTSNGTESITASKVITASGGVTGDVTGNVTGSSGSCTGNAVTATTATVANTLAASGAFVSTEVTGNGAPQNTAHGFAAVPRLTWIMISDSGATGIYTVIPGAHSSTNSIWTVTTGAKYFVFAIK